MPAQAKNVDLFEQMTQLKALDTAWEKVRANGGCAGGDGVTISMFQARAAKELTLLSSAIRGGRYRPGPYRLLRIEKPDGGTRPLTIPSIVDRVAQTACAATLSPVLEPTFSDGSYGYRPGRGVPNAVRAVSEWRKRGYEWVVEADIVRCFERIPHDPLLSRLDAVLAKKKGAGLIVELAAYWLDHAGDALETPGIGLAQGSPLSPLLSNLYLDGLDDALERPGLRVVRYADDFVILCKTENHARKALDLAGEVLDAHGLALKSRKTRIIDFDRGFEFLGHLFVRSMTFKQIADSEEDAVETLRAVAVGDETEALARSEKELELATLLAKGYDPGTRTLYLMTADRRLGLANQSFAVRGGVEEGSALLLSVPHQRIDRIEVGPKADLQIEAIRHALATDTDLAFVDGRGMTLGVLTPPSGSRAALHLAQAQLSLDPVLRAGLARRLIDVRLRNQRALLKRLNRRPKRDDANDAARAIGRLIRKLPSMQQVSEIMGMEGAGSAVFWPVYGTLVKAEGVAEPFRRDRPADDPLDACLNYLTALLGRDVRSAILRAGLHPGFGALHTTRDYGEACVWDLMEPFRSPLTESVVASEFNNGRLRPEHFSPATGGGVHIGSAARRRLIKAYEEAASRLAKSPSSNKRRRWRALIGDTARSYAQHCRSPDDTGAAISLPVLDY